MQSCICLLQLCCVHIKQAAGRTASLPPSLSAPILRLADLCASELRLSQKSTMYVAPCGSAACLGRRHPEPCDACSCRQVLPVYRGRDWVYIEEHLHDVLGKQLREAGDFAEAAQHFVAQLPCAHNQEAWQAYYLRQFLDTVQEAAAAHVSLCPSPFMACIDCGCILVPAAYASSCCIWSAKHSYVAVHMST